MSRYAVSPQARNDVGEIFDFLATKSLSALERYEAKFAEAFDLIGERPFVGHIHPSFLDLRVRVWVVWPYLVIYLPATDPVEIVAVLHGARDVEDLMGRRFPTT